MKKIYSILLLSFISHAVNAQVTTLNETFDTLCAAIGYIPSSSAWVSYDVLDSGNYWGCNNTMGYLGSPSTIINGYYSGVHHVCDVFLITPQMDLTSYPGNVYLQFYSKYQYAGTLIKTKVSTNYMGGNPDSSVYTWTDVTPSLNPTLSSVLDSNKWRLHAMNLTAYKTANVHVAFEYTSTSTTSSRWLIDDVSTNLYPLTVNEVNVQSLSIHANANSNANQVSIWYNLPESGSYTLYIYDIVGRPVYTTSIVSEEGKQKLTLDNLNLNTGLYIIKMAGKDYQGTTKLQYQ